MADPIRVALVGCGGIARAHLAGFGQLAELGRVTVCCDTNRAAAETRAAECGHQPAEVATDLVAVDLCLPHDLHAPATIAAARAGKHVLVEKPIARDLAEADAMIAACDAAGVRLQVAHCQRFSAERQTAWRRVAEGAIGDLYLMRTDHNQWVDYPPEHWINDPEKLGGGSVAGSGVHHLDTLRWFCGAVTTVSASFTSNRLTARTADDAGLVTFEHAGGAISEATICWTVHQFPWYESFWIYGTRGVIHNVGGLQLYAGAARAGAFEPVPLDHDDRGGFREEIRHFLECCRDGVTPRMDGREGRAALELVQAAALSDATGAKVKLPLQA